MVQFCRWKSHRCNASSWSIDYTHYGKCYTFNHRGDHKLLKAGEGLTIFLLTHFLLDYFRTISSRRDTYTEISAEWWKDPLQCLKHCRVLYMRHRSIYGQMLFRPPPLNFTGFERRTCGSHVRCSNHYPSSSHYPTTVRSLMIINCYILQAIN